MRSIRDGLAAAGFSQQPAGGWYRQTVRSGDSFSDTQNVYIDAIAAAQQTGSGASIVSELPFSETISSISNTVFVDHTVNYSYGPGMRSVGFGNGGNLGAVTSGATRVISFNTLFNSAGGLGVSSYGLPGYAAGSPQYGDRSSRNPMTGAMEREIIGLVFTPQAAAGGGGGGGGAVYQGSYTVRRTITTGSTHLRANLVELVGDGEANKITFNLPGMADGGGGDDLLQAGYAGYRLGETRLDGVGAPGALLYGNQGDDRLLGSGHDDVLIGGSGDDLMRGGAGNDTYLVFSGDGHDSIVDWSEEPDDARGDTVILPVGVALADLRFAWSETLEETP